MMSEEPAVKPSRMSGVAVLPWTVALVLFLLFIGVMAALWQGLTADPNVETETKPPEMTAAPPPANTPPPMDAVAPEPTAEAAQAAQEADAASMPEPVPPPVMEPQAEPEVAAAPPPPPVAAPVVSPEPSEIRGGYRSTRRTGNGKEWNSTRERGRCCTACAGCRACAAATFAIDDPALATWQFAPGA